MLLVRHDLIVRPPNVTIDFPFGARSGVGPYQALDASIP